MEKNKAIQLLERLQDPEPYEPMLTKDAYDAIQMAIDALSADGDTISRTSLMSELKDMHREAEKWIADAKNDDVKARAESCLVTITEIKLRVDKMPPAQPQHIRGHWICDRSWSEGVGMGESYGHYWKCDKCGHLEQGDWGECGCNFCSNCGSDNREVTT